VDPEKKKDGSVLLALVVVPLAVVVELPSVVDMMLKDSPAGGGVNGRLVGFVMGMTVVIDATDGLLPGVELLSLGEGASAIEVLDDKLGDAHGLLVARLWTGSS
jgi:hypothetical protein